MIFNKDRPVYKLNLKKELKNKKEEIVRDILKAKHEPLLLNLLYILNHF